MVNKNLTSRLAALLCGVLLALLLYPLPVYAQDSERLYGVDIHAQIHTDGSVTITEVWDVRMVQGTEFYLVKNNLDNMDIMDFIVFDETGRYYEDLGGEWDVNRSMEEKAGLCGKVTTSNGYELCWGIGSYGDHTYTVQYTVTDLVKGYDGGDAIRWVFVSHDMSAKVEDIHITIAADDYVLSNPENTGAWVFNFAAEYGFEDGGIWIQSDGAMYTWQRAAVMLIFEPGMFSLSDIRDENVEDIKAAALKGSSYLTGTDIEEGDTSEGSGSSASQHETGEGEDDPASYSARSYTFKPNSRQQVVNTVMNTLVIGIPSAGVLVLALIVLSRGVDGKKKRMRPEYRDPPYCRTLPFSGSLPAAYTMVKFLGRRAGRPDIIGAYILRWIRRGQAAIMQDESAGKKQRQALLLYGARPGMQPVEAALYDLMWDASSNGVLREKEFEKWCRVHYECVKVWEESIDKTGWADLLLRGVIQRKNQRMPKLERMEDITPAGQQLIIEMFGFKRYLKDFTIVNERQAREVELWDDYLAYAKLFGIADEVAEQFSELYPDYFAPQAGGVGVGYGSYPVDLCLITSVSRTYGEAMHKGGSWGYAAAHSDGGGGSSSSGGGGFSGGGSGGFSGGGGGGGSR